MEVGQGVYFNNIIWKIVYTAKMHLKKRLQQCYYMMNENNSLSNNE